MLDATQGPTPRSTPNATPRRPWPIAILALVVGGCCSETTLRTPLPPGRVPDERRELATRAERWIDRPDGVTESPTEDLDRVLLYLRRLHARVEALEAAWPAGE